MEELQAIQEHYNKIKNNDYKNLKEMIDSIKPDLLFIAKKEENKTLDLVASKINDKNFYLFFCSLFVSDIMTIANADGSKKFLTYNEILSKNFFDIIDKTFFLTDNILEEKETIETETILNEMQKAGLKETYKLYNPNEDDEAITEMAKYNIYKKNITQIKNNSDDFEYFEIIKSELLNILSQEMFYKYIDNNDIIKTLLFLQKYKEEKNNNPKTKITYSHTITANRFSQPLNKKNDYKLTAQFFDSPQEYKQYYFDFLKNDTKYKFDLYNYFNCFTFFDNLIEFYEETEPPQNFNEITKKFFYELQKADINNNIIDTEFFLIYYYNYLQELNDIKAFFNLFLDLHNYTIEKAISKTIEPTKNNNNKYDLHITDKAYKNIENTITNFNTLKNPKAIKDTQSFSGYLKTIAKTKKEYIKMQKNYFDLMQTENPPNRREALEILAPNRNQQFFEFFDGFEIMDFTTKTIFDDFDINTNTNKITSKSNSMELSIDFDNALTLTKESREAKEFLRFIIKKYLEDTKKEFIEFTIFDYDTHKGITNHTQEARTKANIDDIIDALDFARITQKQEIIEKGETHILTDKLHILSREKTDLNIDKKTKTFKIYLDTYFKNFIDDMLDKNNGGQHITYINKRITDLTKTIGNNGQRQKAQAIAEHLTEIKRIRENKPQYKNDFKNNYFIYTCKIEDIIELLVKEKLLKTNYKKSFKRLCVDLLKNVFNILEYEHIAIISTEAFKNYTNKKEYSTGQIMAQKKNNFLQSEITFYLQDIYKALSYKQIISKTNYYKKKKQ